MPSESMGKTIGVATAVCVVCSVFVSTAAVTLKGRQERNRTLDKRKNIIIAAGILEGDERATAAEIDELYGRIEEKWIDFETDGYIEEGDVPKEGQDERKAAKNPNLSKEIQEDLAKIKRKARYRQIYLSGDTGRIVLPVHGKGLWSTMYGFIALDAADLTTIKSFAFYEHAETPGLGGEIDNPTWKKSWIGKKAFDDTWQAKIQVVKGTADPGAVHEVDGLSGATLTARGVEKLVRFWLGEEGYGPLLAELRTGGDHE